MAISLTEPAGIRQRITDADLRVRTGSETIGSTAMLSSPSRSFQEMRFQFEGGELVLTVATEPPDWLEPTARALVSLLDLAPGWDSYGARRVARTHVEAALRILLDSMRHDSPAPTVVPTNKGGVQLEWHIGGIDLEIETLSTQRMLVSFEDAADGTELEEEIVVSNLTPLVDFIGRLSKRV